MAVPGAGCHEYNGSHRETATRGRCRADSDPVRPGCRSGVLTDQPAGRWRSIWAPGVHAGSGCPSALTRRTARFFAPGATGHRPPPGVCRAYDLHSYQKEIAKAHLLQPAPAIELRSAGICASVVRSSGNRSGRWVSTIRRSSSNTRRLNVCTSSTGTCRSKLRAIGKHPRHPGRHRRGGVHDHQPGVGGKMDGQRSGERQMHFKVTQPLEPFRRAEIRAGRVIAHRAPVVGNKAERRLLRV